MAGGIYGVAASCCFMDIAEILRDTHPDAKVRYIFESGAQGSGEVLRNFTRNLKYPENKEYYRLLSLSFEGKKDYSPLQASDILAYELYRYLPRQLGIDPRNTVRREILHLSSIPKKWVTPSDQALANFSIALEAFAKFDKLPAREKKRLWKLGREE